MKEKNMNNTESKPFKMALEGRYKVAIVDGITGEEIWRQPDWNKNLILNQGMDGLATQYLADVTKFGVCGTGTRFNAVPSGESSGSVGGGVFILVPVGSGILSLTGSYGGWVDPNFLAAGDVIQFNNGTEVTIASGITTKTAVVTAGSSQTVSSQSFTIWKTSQTGLQTEIKRGGQNIAGSSYLTGVGNCGSTATGNVVAFLRTIDFSTESILRSYTEVGIAWDSDDSPIASTFSRILLPAAIPIDVNQRLRLAYQLNVAFTPQSASGVLNATVGGWPVLPATNTNMSQSVQVLRTSTIDTAGASTTTGASLEPPAVGATNCAFFGSASSASLVAAGATPPDRSTGQVSIASSAGVYTAGSYTQTKIGTFSVSQLNRTDLRSFGFGYDNGISIKAYNTLGQAFCMLFEQTQSKAATQTLSLTYRWTWSRTLSS